VTDLVHILVKNYRAFSGALSVSQIIERQMVEKLVNNEWEEI
jgi:hypothetical protein